MTDSTPSAKRDTAGRFMPGVAQNPGGRPKQVREVALAAREHTSTAIATLAAIAEDPKAPANARVSAATSLLDRAWGKPPLSVAVSRGADARALHTMTDAELIEFARSHGVASSLIEGLTETTLESGEGEDAAG